MGIVPASAANRLYRLAFSVFSSVSPEYGEQIYLSLIHIFKNYSDFLFKMAGGAVLQWIIEGAKRVIAGDYKIVQPRVVQAVSYTHLDVYKRQFHSRLPGDSNL